MRSATTLPSSGQCICQPQCDGKDCGDNGCGSSCGTCDAGKECSADGICEDSVTVECPPKGPYGTNVNSIMTDIELKDCDGKSYSLHDLCAFNAAWIFGYAEW